MFENLDSGKLENLDSRMAHRKASVTMLTFACLLSDCQASLNICDISAKRNFPNLKGPFHPAFLARVVSWFAFVVAIFMGHENGDKQRLAKRRHVQGMLDETDPLTLSHSFVSCPSCFFHS